MKYIAIIFLVVSPNIFAQTSEDITGKWVFISSVAEKLENEKNRTMDGMLQSMQYHFKTDMSYEGSLLGLQEFGTWLLKDGNIIWKPNNGAAYTREVVHYTKDTLVLKNKDIKIVLAREPEAPASTAKKSLIKQWGLSGVRQPGDVASLKRMPGGNYISLTENGTYNMVFGGNVENGIWDYNEKQNYIILQSNGASKKWKIVSVTNNELVLIMGATGQEFVFSVL